MTGPVGRIDHCRHQQTQVAIDDVWLALRQQPVKSDRAFPDCHIAYDLERLALVSHRQTEHVAQRTRQLLVRVVQQGLVQVRDISFCHDSLDHPFVPEMIGLQERLQLKPPM